MNKTDFLKRNYITSKHLKISPRLFNECTFPLKSQTFFLIRALSCHSHFPAVDTFPLNLLKVLRARYVSKMEVSYQMIWKLYLDISHSGTFELPDQAKQ